MIAVDRMERSGSVVSCDECRKLEIAELFFAPLFAVKLPGVPDRGVVLCGHHLKKLTLAANSARTK